MRETFHWNLCLASSQLVLLLSFAAEFSGIVPQKYCVYQFIEWTVEPGRWKWETQPSARDILLPSLRFSRASMWTLEHSSKTVTQGLWWKTPLWSVTSLLCLPNMLENKKRIGLQYHYNVWMCYVAWHVKNWASDASHWLTVSVALWMRWDKFTQTTEILWRKRDDTAALSVKDRAHPTLCLDRLLLGLICLWI